MTLKFGIIGPGRIANDSLAPAIAAVEGARLWSVLSRDRGRAEAFAERHGAAAARPAHIDLDAMLADDDLDAVVVASPDGLHAEQAVAAARAGKHVFCEKPLATAVAECEAMVAACREAGVRLGVAYHMRWHAGHRRLAADVAAGRFGEIRHMHVQWSSRRASADDWRAATQVGRWWSLAARGTHCLDLVRWLMCPGNGEVTRLESVIDRHVWGTPNDETALLAMQFESGSTAEICTSVVFDAPRRMEVFGADGWVVCEDTLGAEGRGRMWTADGEYGFEPADPYVGEIRDFVAAVRDDREPEVGGAEATRNIALLVEAVTGK